MAATDPGAGADAAGAPAPAPGRAGPVDQALPDGSGFAPLDAPGPRSGDEPLTADLGTHGPRVPTRVLVALVVALAVLVLASVVVGFVILHQPRLTPVPVPSVSAIS